MERHCKEKEKKRTQTSAPARLERASRENYPAVKQGLISNFSETASSFSHGKNFPG